MFFKKKVKFRLAAYLLAASIIITQVNIQSVFALQSNSQQNKMANIDGYRIIASNKVEILVDKPPQAPDPNGTQFKLYEGVGTSGTQITISSAVLSNDTPNQTMTAAINKVNNVVLGYHMPTGGGYLLTAGTAGTNFKFNPGTTYTIVMSNTLAGGTYFTMGHTNSNQDVSISFTCPDTLNSGSNASSVYNPSVIPTVNFMPGNNANNVSLEGNIWFSISVPAKYPDIVLSKLVLKRDGVVSYAPFTTLSTTSNSYDCYAPVYNDDHTFFGFLLTQAQSTYYDFNWKPNSTYTLSIPDIETINGQTIPAQTMTWHTMNGDVPNKLTCPITTSAISANNVKINWNADVAGPVSGENDGWPAADGYNVYVSTDPYWNFVKLNSDMIPQPANSTGNTVVSYIADTSGLLPKTKYYVRIAPLAKAKSLDPDSQPTYLEGGMFTLAGSISTGTVTLPNYVTFTTSAATTVNISGNASVAVPSGSTTENYTAAVKDQYGYTMGNEKVTWSLQSPVTGVSIDPATGVVTVDNTAIGGSSFTVAAADGSLTGSKTVNVVVPVSSVTMSKTTDTLVVGATDQLTAAVAPDNATNKNVTWTSDNTAVATVSNTGLVTAVGAGTANITVTTADGSKTAACAVTVTVPVNGVSLDKTSDTLTVGNTDQLTATIDPANATNQSVTWKSDNTAVATVSNTGLVTAVGAGTANITVTTADGSKTAICAVTVTVPVNGVSLDKTSDTLTVGTTDQLTAASVPDNATDKNFTWTSDNTAVATVSNTGLVTAVSAGTANITVTTEDGSKTATCALTVTVPVNGASLDKTSDTLTVGTTDQLTAAVAPDNATNKNITWASDNTAVATVSNTGLVTAVSKGTANITVTTADGSKTATCTVTVTVPVNGVSLNKTGDTLTVGGTDQLTATIDPANATNQSVTWASDNTAVATVSNTGLVTAVSKGTANITVITADGSKTATCAVTVNPGAPAAPSVPADDAANFTDSSTGITVKGDIPAEASKILVEALDEQSKITDLDKSLSSAASKTETYKTVAAYDLSLLNDSNIKIQPNGTISISVPLDESIANKNLVVFYVDANGVATKMASTLANGVITFTTTHFSQYVIAEVVPVTSTVNSGTNSTASNTSSTNAVSTGVGTTTGGNTTSSANTNGGTAASTISTVSTASGSTTANTDGSTETTTTAGTSSGTTAGTVTTTTNKDSNAANLKTGSFGKFILPIIIAAIMALAGLVLVQIRRRKRLN